MPSHDCGSSPRGRGTHARRTPPASRTSDAVHPRVGGEHHGIETDLHSHCTSVHPRVGGEHDKRKADLPACRGSDTPGGAYNRFIPAWAGNTDRFCSMEHQRGHALGSSPRGRGTPIARLSVFPWTPIGSSPRGRGTRPVLSVGPVISRSVHPRVGGEHCCSSHRGAGFNSKSPVHPRVGGEHPIQTGAWAGNIAWSSQSVTVHPRVGGEHSISAYEIQPSSRRCGSSPRGRGTHLL